MRGEPLPRWRARRHRNACGRPSHRSVHRPDRQPAHRPATAARRPIACRFAIEVHEEIRKQVGDDFIRRLSLRARRRLQLRGKAGDVAHSAAARASSTSSTSFGRMDTKMSLASTPCRACSCRPRRGCQSRRVQARGRSARVSRREDRRSRHRALCDPRGLLDMVGMTRAHIAEPHLVKLVEAGKEDDARPCVGASFCRNFRATCIHNPATSRETYPPHDLPEAAHKKRVLIVGAGPAGLEAARVCASAAIMSPCSKQTRRRADRCCSRRREAGGAISSASSTGACRNSKSSASMCATTTTPNLSDVLDHARGRRDHGDGRPADLDALPGGELCNSVFDALRIRRREQAACSSTTAPAGTTRICAPSVMSMRASMCRLALIDALPAQETGGRATIRCGCATSRDGTCPCARTRTVEVSAADSGKRARRVPSSSDERTRGDGSGSCRGRARHARGR